jgi:hypothetical protein
MSKYLDFLSNTSWVDITSLFKNCPVDEIITEIKNVENLFLLERDPEQYEKIKNKKTTFVGDHFDGQLNWKVVSLYSATGDYKDIFTQGVLPNHDKTTYLESFKNIRNHKWTSVSDHMPETTSWIKHEIGKYMKFSYVKIAKLEPGGVIPQHRDIPDEDYDFLNTQNCYNMLNSFLIELNCPNNVIAMHDNVKLPYKKGSILFCNQGKLHGTTNSGDQTRYNIRIQGLHNKKFRNILSEKINECQCYPETSKNILL